MNSDSSIISNSFLCDSWWYGLTIRMTDEKFRFLAKLRVEQGFNAVQLVVGIPPEIGPENINASSPVGPAWNLKGEINREYLDYAKKRIQFLNSQGFLVLVYGAWGQQIEWLGQQRMIEWWEEIVRKLDGLNVIYCITGESDILVGDENRLLPGKTTQEINHEFLPFIHPRLAYLAQQIFTPVGKVAFNYRQTRRRRKWSNVVAAVSSITNKPVLIHVLPKRTSLEVIYNPILLSAITVQTSHELASRQLLWQLPLKVTSENPRSSYINLEPWYEGILNMFGPEDQLYAYWATMMAGSRACCYGAHGIWNVGDGKFLAQWGKQTFDEAIRLDTPRLIGISHKLFKKLQFYDSDDIKVKVDDETGDMIKITRTKRNSSFIIYVPNVSEVRPLPQKAEFFLPLKGIFSSSRPKQGQVVFISI